MTQLDDIWKDRYFDREISYNNYLALMLQPSSFSDFDRHPDFIEAFRRWTQQDRYRGLDIVRLWSMVLNIKQVAERATGSLAELGVYYGQSSAVLSQYAEQFGRKMYLLDTFGGFSKSQLEPDLEEGKLAAFKDVSLENAQTIVGNYSGNRWVVGMFPDSVTPEMRDDTYSFVSIDCDIYTPIMEGLEFFWPRLATNGMIFVHDYASGHWPGATRAVDEFCQKHGAAGVLLSDMAGSYVLTRQEQRRTANEPARDELEKAQERYNAIEAERQRIANDFTQAKEELEAAREAAARLRSELDELYNSRSWRITGPLRAAKTALSGARQREEKKT